MFRINGYSNNLATLKQQNKEKAAKSSKGAKTASGKKASSSKKTQKVAPKALEKKNQASSKPAPIPVTSSIVKKQEATPAVVKTFMTTEILKVEVQAPATAVQEKQAVETPIPVAEDTTTVVVNNVATEILKGEEQAPAVTAQEETVEAAPITNSKTVKNTSGSFTLDELISFTKPHSEGVSQHFSTFNVNNPFPYSIDGKNNLKEIVSFLAQQVHGLDPEEIEKSLNEYGKKAINLCSKKPLEFMENCMKEAKAPLLQRRAFQMSALMKLIGDLNIAETTEMGQHFQTRKRKVGTVSIDCKNAGTDPISFEIKNELIEVSIGQDKPGAVFLTSRKITIDLPKDNAISYKIEKTLTRLK